MTIRSIATVAGTLHEGVPLEELVEQIRPEAGRSGMTMHAVELVHGGRIYSAQVGWLPAGTLDLPTPGEECKVDGLTAHGRPLPVLRRVAVLSGRKVGITAPAGAWVSADVRAWIERHGGNVSACARRLAVGRTNLQAYAADPSAVRWRGLPAYLQAHMQTLDGLQAWRARWGEETPADARADLEAVLRGAPTPPDT